MTFTFKSILCISVSNKYKSQWIRHHEEGIQLIKVYTDYSLGTQFLLIFPRVGFYGLDARL